jgi:hypothetical protein
MAALFVFSFFITACDSNLSTSTGAELRKRAYRCATDANLTAADIQICSNIQRECKRRQDEGQFDC